MKIAWVVPVGLLLLALGCGGPLVMLPGGSLSGTLTTPPSDWAFTDAVETVQLETRPEDPYSVNIWGVAVDDRFFIVSGRGMESAWAQHIAADPNVKLRVGSDLYELRAIRSEDSAVRERFLTALTAKYEDFDPDAQDSSNAILYHLEAR